MKIRRIVVTGMGVVSPVGIGVDANSKAIFSGVSGIDNMTLFDSTDFATRFAGEVKGFDPVSYLDAKEAKRMDRFEQLAMVAADEAIEASGILKGKDVDLSRIGVCIGSGMGGIKTIQDNAGKLVLEGNKKLSPFFIPICIANMAPGLVAIKHGLKGPNLAVATACATATHMIGLAARLIAYGDADAIVAGGSEAPVFELGVGGFNACRALSKNNDDPKGASKPWDIDRDGFVLAEGGAVLMLESLEYAQKRGANILAELVGTGFSGDAYHMTAPDEEGRGGLQAMKSALADADLKATDIDYINAHGTSTPLGDMVELNAISKLFDNPQDLKKVAISSTKSMTGHALGAAGGMEAVYSILSLMEQKIPPTINTLNIESSIKEKFNIVCGAKYQQHSKNIEYVMSNSFGFGGTNGTLIFKKY